MALLTSPLPQWVTDIGTLTGIVGFIMTILVFIETKSLKKVFKRKVRLPQIQKSLRDSSSKINTYLNDWDNKKDAIKQEFAICVVLAESFSEKLSAKNKPKINEFLDEIRPKGVFGRKRIPINIESSEQAWALYGHLSTLNSRIDEIVNDMKLD